MFFLHVNLNKPLQKEVCKRIRTLNPIGCKSLRCWCPTMNWSPDLAHFGCVPADRQTFVDLAKKTVSLTIRCPIAVKNLVSTKKMGEASQQRSIPHDSCRIYTHNSSPPPGSHDPTIEVSCIGRPTFSFAHLGFLEKAEVPGFKSDL